MIGRQAKAPCGCIGEVIIGNMVVCKVHDRDTPSDEWDEPTDPDAVPWNGQTVIYDNVEPALWSQLHTTFAGGQLEPFYISPCHGAREGHNVRISSSEGRHMLFRVVSPFRDRGMRSLTNSPDVWWRLRLIEC